MSVVSKPKAAADSLFGAGKVLGLIYIATFVVVLLLVMIPLAALIYGSLRSDAPGMGGTWTLAKWGALFSPGVISTLGTTIQIGLASSLIAALIGTAIAIVIHRTDFKGADAVNALVSISFFIPSFILAMAWIIVGSPGGLINGVLEDIFEIESFQVDVYSVLGIIFVMVLHQVPFVYLVMRGPIIGMDSSFEEAARVSGATPLSVLRRVTLPLLSFSLTSSVVLAFILSIEQFAIPALMGIPGHVTVLATQLYLLVRFRFGGGDRFDAQCTDCCSALVSASHCSK